MRETSTPPKYPHQARSAAEIAERMNVHVSVIQSWAEAGCPHFRIDGGEPVFMIGKVKEWALQCGLVVEYHGEVVDPIIRAYPPRDPTTRGLPTALRCLSFVMDMDIAGHGAAGVYFLCLQNEVVYVGQSVNVGARVHSHIDKEFDSVFWLPLPRQSLLPVEMAFIKTLDPPLNGKAGKSLDEEKARKIVESFTGVVG